jgi:acetyltransferase-like isoleucine patch superfamily enzyme
MITMLLPWKLRRIALNKWFGYNIHPTARIGLSWIFPKQLVMGEQSRIDHFSVAVNLLRIEMKANSKIGRSNWITGFPQGHSKHFTHQPERQPVLILGESSAITKHHHIDCTNAINIGAFSTIAGYYSQLLTHSINVIENRQDSEPIFIGDYTFIGTNAVILGGAILPAYSVLGAKSLLNKAFTEEWWLYAGVPAKAVQPIPKNAKYFTRTQGFVN